MRSNLTIIDGKHNRNRWSKAYYRTEGGKWYYLGKRRLGNRNVIAIGRTTVIDSFEQQQKDRSIAAAW